MMRRAMLIFLLMTVWVFGGLIGCDEPVEIDIEPDGDNNTDGYEGRTYMLGNGSTDGNPAAVYIAFDVHNSVPQTTPLIDWELASISLDEVFLADAAECNNEDGLSLPTDAKYISMLMLDSKGGLEGYNRLGFNAPGDTDYCSMDLRLAGDWGLVGFDALGRLPDGGEILINLRTYGLMPFVPAQGAFNWAAGSQVHYVASLDIGALIDQEILDELEPNADGAVVVATVDDSNGENNTAMAEQVMERLFANLHLFVDPDGNGSLDETERAENPVAEADEERAREYGEEGPSDGDTDGDGQTDIGDCLVVTPSELDFGFVYLGSIADRSVQIANGCNYDSLSVSVISQQDESDADFILSELPELPLVLDPGELATVTVRFEPQDLGGKSATLEIISDRGEADVYIHGNDGRRCDQLVVDCPSGHTPPDCDGCAGACHIGYGDDDHPLTTVFRLENLQCDSNDLITISLISLEGADHPAFSLDNLDELFPEGTATPFYLAPNQVFELEVSFQPLFSGVHTARLEFEHDSPSVEQPLVIDLVAIGGWPEFTVAPTALDFGPVPVGDSWTMELTAETTSELPLSFDRVWVENRSPEYSVEATDNPQIYNVTFAPTAATTVEDMIGLYYHMQADAEANVPVTGFGVPACDENLVLTPETLAFGYVEAGTSVQRETDVRNFGTESVSITNITVGGDAGFSLNAASAAALPVTIPPGGQFALAVDFMPFELPAIGWLRIQMDDGCELVVHMDSTELTVDYCRAPSMEPTDLDFGCVDVGETGQLSFIWTSRIVSDMTITDISFDPADSPFASAMPDLPATLPALGTLTIGPLTFTPDSLGDADATLVVTTDSDSCGTSGFFRIPIGGQGCESL